jgi:hypothetical protein
MGPGQKCPSVNPEASDEKRSVMEERRRKRGDRRREPVQGQSFMDVAREAFVRYVALEKWREVEDLRESLATDWIGAVKEAGHFPGRGQYALLWARRWQERVLPQAAVGDRGTLFAAIEESVGESLRSEEEARLARGDRPLEEEPEYKAFLDRTVGRFVGEASAGQEPIGS